ncbi:hypothetical protein Gotur_014041 [Gossypium turneri]
MEEDEDFDLLKDDVMIDNIDGIEAVSFSSKVIKLMEKIMDKAIVIKLLDCLWLVFDGLTLVFFFLHSKGLPQ